MKKNLILFSVLLIIALLSGCKSKQSLSGSGEKATSSRHLVKLIEQAQPDFTTMNASSISVKANISDKRVSASLKIKTDSVIVLSVVPFLGVEAYALELYPDRWILYDKLKRNYYTDNYEYLYYKFGINFDFHALQSLLSARFFSVGENQADLKKLQVTPLESNKNSIRFETKNMIQITTTYGNHVIEKVILSDKDENHKLITTYENYIVTKGINYPQNITFELFSENKFIAGLDMKIQKVAFNTDLKLTTSNPERYTRRTLDQLLK